jgi:hypothetical protein
VVALHSVGFLEVELLLGFLHLVQQHLLGLRCTFLFDENRRRRRKRGEKEENGACELTD